MSDKPTDHSTPPEGLAFVRVPNGGRELTGAHFYAAPFEHGTLIAMLDPVGRQSPALAFMPAPLGEQLLATDLGELRRAMYEAERELYAGSEIDPDAIVPWSEADEAVLGEALGSVGRLVGTPDVSRETFAPARPFYKRTKTGRISKRTTNAVDLVVGDVLSTPSRGVPWAEVVATELIDGVVVLGLKMLPE